MTSTHPPGPDPDEPAPPGSPGPARPPAGTRGAGPVARTFYREYLLSCQPLRLDGGRFQPRVVITAMAGNKTRSQRFLDLDESTATEAEAVDRARRAGMDWVDVNDRDW